MSIDLSNETIKNLFYEQIRALSLKANRLDTFDIQFSERWIK